MEKETSDIVKLTERIAKDPKSKLFVSLAEEYKKSGDIEMAIHVLSEGLKNNPGYITARSSLGRLLLERGDLIGAQKELEEVIKAIPDNLLAQRKLGDIYVLQGRSSDALQRFRTCLALNPGDKELTALIADLGAGQDVTARIPKPKVLTSIGGAKQQEAAGAKAPSSVKTEVPIPAALSAVPSAAPPMPRAAGEETKPATVQPVPPSPQQPAATLSASAAAEPPVPEPRAGGAEAAPHDEVEIVEEIVELEAVEPPSAEAPIGTGEPAPPAETAAAPPQQGIEAGTEGLFDLSEPAAETAAAPPEEPPATVWDAGQPSVPAEQAAPAAAEPSDGINTNTLAELYIAQGFYDKAIEIYQGMLAEDPGNTALQQKVNAIQSMAEVAERNAIFPQQEVPTEQLQPAGAPFTSGVQREQEPRIEEAQVPAPAPPAAEQQEPVGTGEERPTLPASGTAPVTLPQEPPQKAVQEPASPPKEEPAVQGMESNPLLASQDAATRRQATIDRLESWLKNVIKEKP